jgi:hypothetical protein
METAADQATKVTQLADAPDSADSAVGLLAFASLRALLERLEALHVHNARARGSPCRRSAPRWVCPSRRRIARMTALRAGCAAAEPDVRAV